MAKGTSQRRYVIRIEKDKIEFEFSRKEKMLIWVRFVKNGTIQNYRTGTSRHAPE